MIDVKTAVHNAIEYLNTVYDQAVLNDVLLEEVELSPNHRHWLVTVGFSRPVQPQKSQPDILAAIQSIGGPRIQREFKLFKVDADTGEVVSMKRRET
jgi:hypothetical protein